MRKEDPSTRRELLTFAIDGIKLMLPVAAIGTAAYAILEASETPAIQLEPKIPQLAPAETPTPIGAELGLSDEAIAIVNLFEPFGVKKITINSESEYSYRDFMNGNTTIPFNLAHFPLDLTCEEQLRLLCAKTMYFLPKNISESLDLCREGFDATFQLNRSPNQSINYHPDPDVLYNSFYLPGEIFPQFQKNAAPANAQPETIFALYLLAMSLKPEALYEQNYQKTSISLTDHAMYDPIRELAKTTGSVIRSINSDPQALLSLIPEAQKLIDTDYLYSDFLSGDA